MKPKKEKYQKIVLESAMIIFSVLFALLMNEWRTSIKKSSRTERLDESVFLLISEFEELIGQEQVLLGHCKYALKVIQN